LPGKGLERGRGFGNIKIMSDRLKLMKSNRRDRRGETTSKKILGEMILKVLREKRVKELRGKNEL